MGGERGGGVSRSGGEVQEGWEDAGGGMVGGLLDGLPEDARYSVYLLYWYKSTNTDAAQAPGSLFRTCGLEGPQSSRYSIYSLDKRTNPDAEGAAGTKVQILTQKVLLGFGGQRPGDSAPRCRHSWQHPPSYGCKRGQKDDIEGVPASAGIKARLRLD